MIEKYVHLVFNNKKLHFQKEIIAFLFVCSKAELLKTVFVAFQHLSPLLFVPPNPLVIFLKMRKSFSPFHRLAFIFPKSK
jgi:hypothetical protein